MILLALTLAQTTAAAAAPVATPTPILDAPKVCKRIDPPAGSRMGSRRVCHTEAEWTALQNAVDRDMGAIKRQ